MERAPATAHVLPDACIDILSFGGQLVVAGPDTGSRLVSMPPGTSIAAVRFRPGAAPALLGVPTTAILDQTVPLAELWGRAATDRLAATLAEIDSRAAPADAGDGPAQAPTGAGLPAGTGDRTGLLAGGGGGAARAGAASLTGADDRAGLLAGGGGAARAGAASLAGTDDRSGLMAGGGGRAARVAALQAELRQRLPRAEPVDPLTSGVVAELAAAAGARSVAGLADFVGLSERQLHRRCRAAFGYGPKTLDRVLRLQRFLALGRSPGRRPDGLAGLAAVAGYADQAHLAHECRRLAGTTPAALLA